MQAQPQNTHYPEAQPWNTQQPRMGNLGQAGESFAEQVSFDGDFTDIYNSYREPNVPINYYGNTGAAGIKIRSRLGQRPAPNTIDVQGNAPRRIRLVKSVNPVLATNGEDRDSHQRGGEDEVQSATTVVRINT